MVTYESTSRAEASQEEVGHLAKLLQAKLPSPSNGEPKGKSCTSVPPMCTVEDVWSTRPQPDFVLYDKDDRADRHLITTLDKQLKVGVIRGMTYVGSDNLFRYDITFPGNVLTGNIVGPDGVVEVPSTSKRFLVDIYDDGRPIEVWDNETQPATSQDVFSLYNDIELAREMPEPPA